MATNILYRASKLMLQQRSWRALTEEHADETAPKHCRTRTLKSRKNESVSPFFFPHHFSSLLFPLFFSPTEGEKHQEKLASTPIVPAFFYSTCSCLRRLESRRSAEDRSPQRHCRESRRRVASPPLVRRRRRLRMSVPPRRLWPLATPRSRSRRWPWSPLGAPKTRSTVRLFSIVN